MIFSKEYIVRWADMDANVHMRHSAYNDYAAQTRLMFMAEHGIDMMWFKENNIFPVLFREETIFLKEIHGSEKIKVDTLLLKISEDGSRWSILNRFYKEDGTLAAKLTVDGAWMDIVIRKLKAPPAVLVELFKNLEKADDIEKS
jgi:acyl-CoA thioester hydrolase